MVTSVYKMVRDEDNGGTQPASEVHYSSLGIFCTNPKYYYILSNVLDYAGRRQYNVTLYLDLDDERHRGVFQDIVNRYGRRPWIRSWKLFSNLQTIDYNLFVVVDGDPHWKSEWSEYLSRRLVVWRMAGGDITPSPVKIRAGLEGTETGVCMTPCSDIGTLPQRKLLEVSAGSPSVFSLGTPDPAVVRRIRLADPGTVFRVADYGEITKGGVSDTPTDAMDVRQTWGVARKCTHILLGNGRVVPPSVVAAMAVSLLSKPIMTREQHAILPVPGAVVFDDQDTDAIALDKDYDAPAVERFRSEQQSKVDHIYDEVTLKSHPTSTGRDIHIPKKIHMLWIHFDALKWGYPDKYERNVEIVKRLNPGYEVKVWSETDIDDLFLEHFTPEEAKKYHDMKPVICKCDLARFAILAVHGGIYMDMDFICFLSLDTLVEGRTAIVFRELSDHEVLANQLYNGFMAAVPEHPFMVGWCKHILKTFPSSRLPVVNMVDVMSSTGPIGLWRYYTEYSKRFRAEGREYEIPELLDSVYVMPRSRNKLSRKYLKGVIPYAFTRWGEGSNWPGRNDDGELVADPFLAALAGILFFIILLVVVIILLYRLAMR